MELLSTEVTTVIYIDAMKNVTKRLLFLVKVSVPNRYRKSKTKREHGDGETETAECAQKLTRRGATEWSPQTR